MLCAYFEPNSLRILGSHEYRLNFLGIDIEKMLLAAVDNSLLYITQIDVPHPAVLVECGPKE